MARTVVITGASGGVGRATARRFAAPGVSLGLIARDEARLANAAKEVEEAGGQALVCPADVADAEAVEQAAERIERELGPIDVWINAAMATIFGRFIEVAPEEYRRATEVTYLGFVHGTMSALKRMYPRDRGVIIQIGSALAYRSIPLQAAYCGAKHAIVGFTDSLRCELIHDRSAVKLSVVHLPGINTPQFDWGRNKMAKRPQPMPPIYQPEIAAEAIHYVAEHPRRELWLGWSSVQAILGQRVAPGLLDHMLASQAWGGQQTQEDEIDRDDNLFSTVEGDFGAHGRFDGRARAGSSEFWVARNAGLIGLVGAAAAAGVLVAGLIGRR